MHCCTSCRKPCCSRPMTRRLRTTWLPPCSSAARWAFGRWRCSNEANTGTYGHPEPTHVNIGVTPGPAILVSGHDLRDLDELLQQSEGTGVNIYTHGEMLPANAYPAFKKYPHFVGNYGGSWWHQQTEFDKFGGAILMTTNCIVPREGQLSRSDLHHRHGRLAGGQTHSGSPERRSEGLPPGDFSAALAGESPQPLEEGTIPIGFAHTAVLSVADKVIEAVKSGRDQAVRSDGRV